MMQIILQTIAWLIVSREKTVWYRIDRITQTRLDKRAAIEIEHGIDAVFAQDPHHALLLASQRNPLRTNQLFQAVFCGTRKQHDAAVEINRARDCEMIAFENYMHRLEKQLR